MMLDYQGRETAVRQGVNLLRTAMITVLICFGVFLFFMIFAGHNCGSRESANKIKCAANLRQIGTGLQLYASANHGQYPRGFYDPTKADSPTAFTHADDNAGQLFTAGNAPVNDVTVTFFILLKTGDLTPGVFVCPSANDDVWPTPPAGIDGFSNLPKPEYLSYSINNPYLKSDDPAARDTWWAQAANASEFKVIAADMNPGIPDLLKLKYESTADEIKKFGNSPNHDRAGQNVLYADGHVDWRNTPFNYPMTGDPSDGQNVDNIYTYGTGANQGIIGSSTGGNDAILLPTATMK